MSSATPENLNQIKQSEYVDGLLSKISALSELPVSEHVAAYEEIHGDLQKALSEIEGL